MPYHYAEASINESGELLVATVEGADEDDLHVHMQSMSDGPVTFEYGHMLSLPMQSVFYTVDNHIAQSRKTAVRVLPSQLIALADLSLVEGKEIMKARLKKERGIPPVFLERYPVHYGDENGELIVPAVFEALQEVDVVAKDTAIIVPRFQIASLASLLMVEGGARYLQEVA